MDIASIAFGIYDIYTNGLNWENGLSLAADVVGLILPGVTGGGLIVKAVMRADDAVDAARTLNAVGNGVEAVADTANALQAGNQVANAADAAADVSKTLPSCSINSFSAYTPVETIHGPRSISSITTGDWVLAYHEATGTTGYYQVTDTISHIDPVIVVVTLEGETIETTPEHPFYTLEEGWVGAGDLQAGQRVRQADGEHGAVLEVEFLTTTQRMYNLTVAEAHTFFVGDEDWLVHNCGPQFQGGRYGDLPGSPQQPVHHMPPKSTTSPILQNPKADGPAIQMDYNDHIRTSSYGGGPGSRPDQYRTIIGNLINSGEVRKAMAIEILDVRRVARLSGNGMRYNNAINQALDYARRIGMLAR